MPGWGREGCQAGNLALPHARLCLPHPAERAPQAVYFLSGMGVLSPSPSPPPCPHHRLPKLPNQISPCTLARLAWRPAADGNEARLRISHRLSDAGTCLGGGGWGGAGVCSWPRTVLGREAGASPSCLSGGPLRTSEQVADCLSGLKQHC